MSYYPGGFSIQKCSDHGQEDRVVASYVRGPGFDSWCRKRLYTYTEYVVLAVTAGIPLTCIQIAARKGRPSTSRLVSGVPPVINILVLGLPFFSSYSAPGMVFALYKGTGALPGFDLITFRFGPDPFELVP